MTKPTEQKTNATPTNTGKTVQLDQPIKRGEQTISSVTVNPMDTCGALRGLKLLDLLQQDVDTLVKLLPRITTPALTPQDVYKLSPADLTQLAMQTIDFFVPKSAQTESQQT